MSSFFTDLRLGCSEPDSASPSLRYAELDLASQLTATLATAQKLKSTQ